MERLKELIAEAELVVSDLRDDTTESTYRKQLLLNDAHRLISEVAILIGVHS